MQKTSLIAYYAFYLTLSLLPWSANAYDITGHYYTVLALIDNANEFKPDLKSELDMQTFCVELPDLAMELDATTQRIHVFKAWNDWSWGGLGPFSHCSTPKSKHMVATHYFLHGLAGIPVKSSGNSSASIRIAAQNILQDLNDKLDRGEGDRMVLRCAQGFALHLLGDSFAHVNLKDESKMYEPGLGHARDKHKPDFVFAHTSPENKWQEWVYTSSNSLVNDDSHNSIKAIYQQVQNEKKQKNIDCELHPDNKNCEQGIKEKLIGIIKARNRIPINNSVEKFNTGGLFNLEITNDCKTVITTAQKANPSIPSIKDPDLFCKTVWKEYLGLAVKKFLKAKIDFVNGPYKGSASCAVSNPINLDEINLDDGL